VISRCGFSLILVIGLIGCGFFAQADQPCSASASVSPENDASIRAVYDIRRALPPQSLDRAQTAQYDRYLEGTLASLDRMRMPNGLIVDKVQAIPGENGRIRYETLNANTSPTNMGLDLLIQLELLRDPARNRQAAANLLRMIGTLEKMQRHPETGLYYSWYEAENAQPKQRNVSSVDNIHLALALWAASKSAPDEESRRRAERLFQKMDFSAFLDEKTGLIGGNLQFQMKDGKETWFREPWNYSNFGAESRSIYGLTHALGLMRKKGSEAVLEKSPKNIRVEVARTPDGEILRTWDGGAFQLLLPRLLIREDQYSPSMQKFFRNYADHVLAQRERESIPLPASYSACNFGVDDEPERFSGVPSYVGKAGSPALVSADHQEFRGESHRKDWDRVVTPHAIFLAAATNPGAFSNSLSKAEKLGSQDRLYEPEVGWMDGIHVRQEHRGKVIPVQLSLDQSMIALSLLEMKSSDNRTSPSRLLESDPQVRSRLGQYYSAMEPRLASTPASGSE
jgi:hypothetical protein